MADADTYCLAMANAAGVDLADAVRRKVEVNARKYPADRYRGRYWQVIRAPVTPGGMPMGLFSTCVSAVSSQSCSTKREVS